MVTVSNWFENAAYIQKPFSFSQLGILNLTKTVSALRWLPMYELVAVTRTYENVG